MDMTTALETEINTLRAQILPAQVRGDEATLVAMLSRVEAIYTEHRGLPDVDELRSTLLHTIEYLRAQPLTARELERYFDERDALKAAIKQVRAEKVSFFDPSPEMMIRRVVADAKVEGLNAALRLLGMRWRKTPDPATGLTPVEADRHPDRW